MEKIILPRGEGKTTKLIQMSHDTWTYILVVDGKRQREVANLARKMEIDIPYPVTLEDYMRSRFHGSFIRRILIDDADDVLKALFSNLEISAITMTEQGET